jgi:hypothetical protein
MWNRRHNVSPHEPEGSSGLAGMVMSALSAPLYTRSFAEAVLRRRSGFVVTPKGDSASPDRLMTFRIHLFWAALLGTSLVASFFLGHTHVAMRTWAALALAISLTPVLAWQGAELRGRIRARRAGKAARTAEAQQQPQSQSQQQPHPLDQHSHA